MICSLGFAQPNTNAQVPDKLAENVISIYSDSYTSVATNYNPYWGQSGSVNTTFDPTSGGTNFAMAYTNFNYQGTELTTQNASGMEYLHVDIWTSSATVIQVTPINNGAGTGAGEALVNVPLVNGGWSSVDIPKSDFTGMTWDKVFQLKFANGGANATIYLDNIYFWKTPADPNKDATLSDLKVDATTVTGFSSSAFSYTLDYVVGTTVVPQITLATPTNGSATVTTITQASGIPGDATVLVTSADQSTTKTYTISFKATIPNASPIPTTPDAEVLSIYGDTGGFTNKWIKEYDFGGYSSITDLDLGSGVNEAIKMNFAAVGYGQGKAAMDISAYNYLHFDYYVDPNLAAGVNGEQVRFILIGNGEHYYEMTSPTASDGTLVKGSWQSVNVPISFFTNKGFDKTAFIQFKLGTASDLNTKIVYFDNIYFSVNQPTTLGNTKFEKSSLKVYPNPATSNLTIEAKNAIERVSVHNVLGQEVLSRSPKTNNTTLDISNLQKGTYIVRTTSEGATETTKVIKK